MTQKGMKRVFLTKLTDVNSSDKEGVGTVRREGDDEYIYCKGVSGTSQYDVMEIGDDYATAEVDTTDSDYAARLGIAQAEIGENEYGWYQVRGHSTVAAASGTDPNKSLYLNNSKEVTESDDSGDNPPLKGIIVLTSESEGTVTAFILDPYTGPN